MDPVEATAGDAVSHSAFAETKRKELREGDDPVLTSR
jgi:hypothetical protein